MLCVGAFNYNSELSELMKYKTSILFIIFMTLFTFAFSAYSGSMTENQKIEGLVKRVEGLEDAVFIRNGSDHTPKEAADHMRLKLKNAGKRIKTARDFIKYCGTGSSMTGEPYKIRFKAGSEKNSADVLAEFLKDIEEGK